MSVAQPVSAIIGQETFTYSPLSSEDDEIRLLRIPRKLSDSSRTIQYTLFQTFLKDTHEFVALSYCWGIHKTNHAIKVNEKLMYITESLATALDNLIPDDKDLLLWADAICINQKDALEKTKQVQLMRDIYRNAEKVIIWLGPSTTETYYTIRELRKLGDELIDAGLWDLSNKDILHWDVEEQDESKPAVTKRAILRLRIEHQKLARNDEYPFWWIMSDFGQRQWFHRIWCIQECTNARTAIFRCGKDEVEFTRVWAVGLYFRLFSSSARPDPSNDITDFWKDNWLTNMLSDTIPTTVIGIRRRHLLTGGLDLRTLLDRVIIKDAFSASIDASDPRDRVYALLGIANDDAAKEIVADYTSSCEEAYIRATRALLRHGHDDVLSMCRIRTSFTNLPTWVPDWSTDVRKPWSTWLTNERLFNASGNGSERLLAPPKISSDIKEVESRLSLRGVRVDTIRDVGHQFSHGINDRIDWTKMKHFFDDVSAYLSRSDRYTDEQKEQAEWRIPVGDTEVADWSNQMKRASPDSHMKAGFIAARALSNETASPEQLQNDFLPFAQFQCQLGRMYDSRPFISESGYVGLCPLETRPGDAICIFIGARVPYITRKGGDDAAWVLIGESHVYGIMDGELMLTNPKIEGITLI